MFCEPDTTPGFRVHWSPDSWEFAGQFVLSAIALIVILSAFGMYYLADEAVTAMIAERQPRSSFFESVFGKRKDGRLDHLLLENGSVSCIKVVRTVVGFLAMVSGFSTLSGIALTVKDIWLRSTPQRHLDYRPHWHGLIAVSGVSLFVAFFLPSWSMRVPLPELPPPASSEFKANQKAGSGRLEVIGQNGRDHGDWCLRHFGLLRRTEIFRELNEMADTANNKMEKNEPIDGPEQSLRDTCHSYDCPLVLARFQRGFRGLQAGNMTMTRVP